MTVEKLALIGGSPGSGKSSIANVLSSQTRLGYMSTGNHIRAISAGETESLHQKDVAAESKHLNRSGRLPPTLVCAIIEEHFRRSSVENDMILDGYPRSIEQVGPFFDTITSIGTKVMALVYLEVDREESIKRMLNRGNRGGECPINVDFARMRYDKYIESYDKVLAVLSNEIPIHRVQANESLDNNVVSTRSCLDMYFGNL